MIHGIVEVSLHAGFDGLPDGTRNDGRDGAVQTDNGLVVVFFAYPLVHMAHFIFVPDECSGVALVFQDVMKRVGGDGLTALPGDAGFAYFVHDFRIGTPRGVHLKDHANDGGLHGIEDIPTVRDIVTKGRIPAAEQAALRTNSLARDGFLAGLQDIELADGRLDGLVQKIGGIIEITDGGRDGKDLDADGIHIAAERKPVLQITGTARDIVDHDSLEFTGVRVPDETGHPFAPHVGTGFRLVHIGHSDENKTVALAKIAYCLQLGGDGGFVLKVRGIAGIGGREHGHAFIPLCKQNTGECP